MRELHGVVSLGLHTVAIDTWDTVSPLKRQALLFDGFYTPDFQLLPELVQRVPHIFWLISSFSGSAVERDLVEQKLRREEGEETSGKNLPVI